MKCFCKKCRNERKVAAARAKIQAEMVDLPRLILENYLRAHIAKQAALQET